jgi:DNA-binding IclR family transcriptional regulator
MNAKQKSPAISYSAPIVSKAMRVLKMIISEQSNPGISEIASQLELAKSTTHGILAALEETGWVLRDPITRKYTCGYAVRRLADNAAVQLPLVDTARPYLERLSLKLDEDVFLGMCTGYSLLIIDQIESRKEIKITAKPGTRISMYAGAAGKIFLAFHDEERINEILEKFPIPSFTNFSITEMEAYKKELSRVRQEGVAHDAGEYLNNVGCVAAPIFHGKKTRKRMVAGFWLVGLDWLKNPEKVEIAKKLAIETSEAISRAISNYK